MSERQAVAAQRPAKTGEADRVLGGGGAQARLLGVTCVILACSSGCREDKRVATSQLGEAMALHSYQPFTLKDGCELAADYSGHCTTEQLLESSVTSSDPGVFEVLTAAEGPTELGLTQGWLVHAVGPGTARLDVEAKFDDGTVRKASKEITVRKATRMVVGSSCVKQGVVRMAVGEDVQFDVSLFADQAQLSGVAPNVLRGPGLTVQPSLSVASTFVLWEPTEAGEVALTSDVIDKVPIRLIAVSEADVSIDSLAPAGTPPYAFTLGQPAVAHLAASAGGEVLCGSATVDVRTETPEVCTGSDGELAWEEAAAGAVVFRLNAPGTCRLSVGTSQGQRRSFEFPCVAR